MRIVITHLMMFLLLQSMSINSQTWHSYEIMWFGALIWSALKHSKVPLKIQPSSTHTHNFLGF